MDRGKFSPQRSGTGHRGGQRSSRVSRGGRGEYRGNFQRANSNSSGTSSGNSTDRPIVNPPSTPPHSRNELEHVFTPEKSNLAPQHSSYTLSGNRVNEKYTPTRSGNTTPSSLLPRNSNTTSIAAQHLDLPSQSSPSSSSSSLNLVNNTSSTPLMSQTQGGCSSTQSKVPDWVLKQETRIILYRIPKLYWIRDIYAVLSKFGDVVRIEMHKGSRDNNATVIFQPTIRSPPDKIYFKSSPVRWDWCRPFVKTVPSPIDPSRQHYEQTILLAKSIKFGTQDNELSMISMQDVKASNMVRLTLNLSRKELDIQFPIKIDDRIRKLRFRLPISLISKIYKCKAKEEMSLIIPFNSPPQFFVQKTEGEALLNGDKFTSFIPKEYQWNDWSTWFRITDVVDDTRSKWLRGLPLMNHKDEAVIDIGYWTTYQVCFNEAGLDGSKFQAFAAALTDYGVDIEESSYTIQTRFAAPLWTMLEEEISGTRPDLETATTSKPRSRFDELFVGQTHLAFAVRYQLEVCLSNGYLKEHNITQGFLDRLASANIDHTINLLEKVAEKQQIFYDPMDIFSLSVKHGPRKKNPDHYMPQRSAIITPTSILVASPSMDISNRITRKHAADADRFIRVRFSDEKTEGILRNMPNHRAEALFERVSRAIRHGIVVAGRHYEFLAFGNSQFREHGAYFYAPTSTNSAEDIRRSLGSFGHIKTVAKYAARLGQCFSTTREMGITVNIKNIQDIEHAQNGYCFTDGVGKMSLFLSQMAVNELGLAYRFHDPPSVCQFRMGGCKGVLAVDPSVTGSEVHIRPSQRKFEAVCKGLEFIRFSSFATPYFNRQIIMVLSSLGVPDGVFIAKQQAMMQDYELAMQDEMAAIRKLRTNVDMNQTTLMMAGMVLDGFMKHREPFIMSLLRLWRAATIKGLKERARIAIDKGAFVLGCVDETATLKGHRNDPQSMPDATRDEKMATLPEVFLRVDDTDKEGYYRVIEGVCILARNPSLHPGDVRVVRAVDVPALHHLKNVVVLPQTGDRDLASMCSGGDLDGDDYMVLWDADLLPKIINMPPMDFTTDRPLEKDGKITVEDIGEFFVTYMMNDTLGTIAHAHLAQADQNADGVRSEVCLQLAHLHSQAVDYPKSGIPAVMGRELTPRRYPHFMEKKHLAPSKTYKSSNVLGVLYDLVELVDFEPQLDCPFDDRILKAYELDEVLLVKAVNLKISYDRSFRQLMAKYGIHTEFEAWSVFILEHNQGKGKDYKLAEDFGRTVETLKAEHRKACREAAEVVLSDWARLGPFVAAMYTVTAREMEKALQSGSKEMQNMPLISFPWLFPAELGKIARSSKTRSETLFKH